MSSSLWAFNETAERDKALAAKSAAEIDDLRARGFTVFAWDDLTEAGEGWLADADGNLWTVATGEPLEGHQPSYSAAALGRGMVVRAGAYGRQNDPPTLAVLQRQVEAKQAQQARAKREAQAVQEAMRKAAAPVTASRLAGRQAMTLRQAGEAVEHAAGRLEVRGGRLVVYLPTDAMPGTLAAASLLYDADRGLAETAARKGQQVVNEICAAGSKWTVYHCTWTAGSATVTFKQGKKRWTTVVTS